MSAEFRIEDVPKDQLASALGKLLSEGFRQHPDALWHLIMDGEAQFVQQGVASDKFGLQRQDYVDIFRRLMRLAKRMGISRQVH